MSTDRPPRLADKVALITGGAGSIGLATARAFVAEGARVLIADLDQAALERAAGELGDGVVAWAVTDVTDPGQVGAAVAQTVDTFGALHCAFANAGVFGVVSPVAEYPVDVFNRVMAVNVTGSFLVAQSALRVMEEGGSLIINSSVVGLTSDRGIAAYATSKHAVVGLMRTAAKEMAPKGIRVNSIHPGPTDNVFQHTHRGRGDRRLRGGVGQGLRADDPAGAPRRARGDRPGGGVPGQRREPLHDRPHAHRGRRPEHLTPARRPFATV